MNFLKHSPALEGQHAFLGASNYHWLNYDDEKLYTAYVRNQQKEKGTKLHAFAASAIELGQKLPRTPKTINMYVNDAIGFKMTPEQMLYYSDNCFGTADAICYREVNGRGLLRIHDLKTGIGKTSFKQLYIYAALFCLEYKMNPNDFDMELRIYQLDDVQQDYPPPEIIMQIMKKIQDFDKLLSKIKMEEN